MGVGGDCVPYPVAFILKHTRIIMMKHVHESLTQPELQQIVLRVPYSKLHKYLGCSKHQLSQLLESRQVRKTFTWLEDKCKKDRKFLLNQLASLGSYDKLSKYYHVSPAYLKQLLQPKATEIPSEPRVVEIRALYAKLGSLKLVSYIVGRKLSEVQAIVAINKIPKPFRALYRAGYTSDLGRQGEVEYLDFRGLSKDYDMNYKDPSAPFDVDDPKYGKVNVKAAALRMYRSRNLSNRIYHKFSLRGITQCDHLAFMCYDKKGHELLEYYVVPPTVLLIKPSAIMPKNTRTFAINHKNRHLMQRFRNPHVRDSFGGTGGML